MFKAGQKVWCLLWGEGVVYDIVEGDEPYVVDVVFQGTIRSYTADGRPLLGAGRTLFFSKPEIKGATEPPFQSKLKGKRVMLETKNCGNHVYTIYDETEGRIYLDKEQYWLKSEINTVYILEEVKL